MSSASLREIGSDVLTHFGRVVQMLSSSPTAQGEAVPSFSPYKDDVHLEQERGMNILRHIPGTCWYTRSLGVKPHTNCYPVSRFDVLLKLENYISDMCRI